MYYCKKCKRNVEPERDERGREKVARFFTGFVARFLECGHSVPVTQPPVRPAA